MQYHIVHTATPRLHEFTILRSCADIVLRYRSLSIGHVYEIDVRRTYYLQRKEHLETYFRLCTAIYLPLKPTPSTLPQ